MSLHYQDIEEKAVRELRVVTSLQELEILRVRYLGRKGCIAQEISKIPTLGFSERALAGRQLNELKRKLNDLIESKRPDLAQKSSRTRDHRLDTSLPGTGGCVATIHPITQVMDSICEIFISFGFMKYEGPEVETEYSNFQALNIPLEHSSRDAFDTFYLESDRRYKTLNEQIPNSASASDGSNKLLLRSHTSPGQIRVMKEHSPPVAAIVPGRVYRPDATDASHSCMFHQVEGFLVDKDVRFSDLKGILEKFFQQMFGSNTAMRFRPHFFPFTEPSAEVDISCIICDGKKINKAENKPCSVCKGTGWLEILGCGMIHPNVFKAVGYDNKKFTPLEKTARDSRSLTGFTGFAFGMGVERIAMLKYGIDDIRIFFDNDLRFLKQF